MKKILLCLILIFQYQATIKAQNNFGKSWVIGTGGYTIKFDNPISHDTSHKNIFMDKGSSNICDSSGDILLMSNGMKVWNKFGILLDGGDTLVSKDWFNFNDGNSIYSQASIFLPIDNKKYYLVTPALNDTQLYNSLNIYPWKGPCNVLLYNVIDMNANGGAGKVVERMKPIVENEEMLKTCMMACRHANGKDWWLLKQAGDSVHGNRVFKFLFTQDSIINKGVQTIPYPFRGYIDLYGQMKFSNDGKKWASTYSAYPSTGEVYIADFDRCTGVLSNFDKIIVEGQATGFPIGDIQADTSNFGLEFSPNGQLLYISRYSHIMQYQFQTQTFSKVCGMDTTYSEFWGYTSLVLGIDNKIYIGHFGGGSRQFSVIDNPNGQGVTCNFCRKCLRTKSSPTEIYSLLSNPPCMPNYELGADLPCWAVGTEEYIKDSEVLEIYPNPAFDKLIVKSDKRIANSEKELYNSVGQLIFSTKENEIDVRNFARGVYYLKCGSEVRKVVVK